MFPQVRGGFERDRTAPKRYPWGTTKRPRAVRQHHVRGASPNWIGVRLMSTIVPSQPRKQVPRPALCPTCGLAADNGILVRSELTATATYVDTAGHIFSVTWVEVAG